MAYAITKAGVRWFLDSYPMPMPLNLMALQESRWLDAVIQLLEDVGRYGRNASAREWMFLVWISTLP